MAYTKKTWADGDTITASAMNNLESGAAAAAADLAAINAEKANWVKPSGTKSITSNGTGIDVKSYEKVNVNVPTSGGSGIDTSDATATAQDLAKDVTAYVNGAKITGTATVYSGRVGWSDRTPAVVSGTSLQLASPAAGSGGWLFKSGATLTLSAQLSSFGDAAAADVAEGKTFTSAEGLKVVGTGAGAGGGVKSGTVSVASAADSFQIETGLSSINGFAVYAQVPSGSTSGTFCWVLMSFADNAHSSRGIVAYKNSSYSPSAGTMSSSYYEKSGGTLTLKKYSTFSIQPGTFYWVAW